MKSSTGFLYVLVVLSLVFSLTSLIIVTQNNHIFTPISSTPTPTTNPDYTLPTITISTLPTSVITPSPPPSPPPPKTELTLNYTETTRVEINDMTKVTLTIDLTYNSGPPITLKYSDFYLNLIVYRIYPKHWTTAMPQNSGSFTLDSSHQTQTFQLTFEFSTKGFNGMDEVTAFYRLSYNGLAEIQWENQQDH